ncbi:conserved hypothetical protein [Vibrio chagasii]|uniref:hypothetical protein n=1 Tax=Vibrio chagasii TaxID=170679 RepID=UPI001EFC31C2|nr:hypothetical protein [Vibrio chagasii]MDE9381658.1 hypothetical protein [Vibrio alginolyticus]MCG9606055.1 hypothetical protein [Vibrio chagasii]CAH6837793.1 conserved hypothetical protein [Vibrio chagasii]CAH6838228.1 conserved hypothetical protein [Vibrio chagasii]CAH6886727.1 conserved hypothetical protein [Vibrio chagasii]
MNTKQLEDAVSEVTLFNQHLHLIQSVHTIPTPKVNWESMAMEPAPVMPTVRFDHKVKAMEALDDYKPNWLDMLLGNKSKLHTLTKNVERAAEQDIEDYKSEFVHWVQNYSYWAKQNQLSKGVLNNDSGAKLTALSEAQQNPINASVVDTKLINHNFNTYKNGHLLEINIQVNKDNVIPKERKVLCQGEVKLKNLSVPESNILYREYVCSCVLKCAQDSFNVLPETSVVINVEQASAEHSNETILSCHIEKGLLEFLLIEDDKPSEILEFFVHLEDFNPHRGNGFSAIQTIFSPLPIAS